MNNLINNSINNSEKIFTGHYDMNKPIYVGDKVKEGCNGIISEVEFNQKRGTYGLKGCSGDYNIKDSEIECKILNE